MAFSKSFPRTTDKSVYPKWEEIFLSDSEEREIEKEAHRENIRLMEKCIDDAKDIIAKKGLKAYQSDLLRLAISLFEKQASHSVYWKERRAKDRFDELYSK